MSGNRGKEFISTEIFSEFSANLLLYHSYLDKGKKNPAEKPHQDCLFYEQYSERRVTGTDLLSRKKWAFDTLLWPQETLILLESALHGPDKMPEVLAMKERKDWKAGELGKKEKNQPSNKTKLKVTVKIWLECSLPRLKFIENFDR